MIALSETTERLLRPFNNLDARNFLRISLNKQQNGFLLHLYSQHVVTKRDAVVIKTDATGSMAVKEVREVQKKGYEYHSCTRKNQFEWESVFAKNIEESQKRHPYRCYDFPSRFPEIKQVKAGDPYGTYYEVPATDYTVEIIRAIWPKEQLAIDGDAQIVYDKLLLVGKREDKFAEDVASYKMHKIVPIRAQALDYHSQFELSNYQKVAAANAYLNNYALFMKQGTGKTPVAISVICNEAKKYSTDRMYRVIIVCPKNVRDNWVHEFKKFSTEHGKCTILDGTQVERLGQIAEAFSRDDQSKFTAVICGYEMLNSQTWDALQLIEWDRAILDESHFIKNMRAKRTKQALKLRDIAQYRMILTGTPTSNHYFELFPQFEFLGEGYSGFSSYEKFRDFFGQYDQRGGYNVITNYRNIPFLQERLARKSFIITKEEALPELPKKNHDIRTIDMSPEQWEVYKEVANNLYVEAESELESTDNKELTVNNILKKFLKLAQITSGFIAWDAIKDDDGEIIRPSIIDRFDPDNKLEQLVEDLKEKDDNQKTIIWSCWTQNIKTITARLKLEGIDCVQYYGQTKDEDRKIAEHRFNCDPKCKVFVGNPAAGGVGLNLLGFDPNNPDDYDTNCDHVIYYSQNWSSVVREQSEDRANRRGTRVPTQITDYVVPHTIDELIRERVVEKRINSYKLNDLRSVLSSILDFKGHGVSI